MVICGWGQVCSVNRDRVMEFSSPLESDVSESPAPPASPKYSVGTLALLNGALQEDPLTPWRGLAPEKWGETLEKEIWIQRWFWGLRRVSSGAISSKSRGMKDGQSFWDWRSKLPLGPWDSRHPESGGVWESEKRASGFVTLGAHVQGLWPNSVLREKSLLPDETVMVGRQLWWQVVEAGLSQQSDTIQGATSPNLQHTQGW